MRFREAIQTERSQTANENNLRNNSHPMNLGISHQYSVQQQHQASINHQQQHLFRTDSPGCGTFTRGVNCSRSSSPQAGNMIENPNILPFGSNNV